MEAVLTVVADGVALITLNRPEVFNALDRTLGEGLVRAFEGCAADDAVRAIILTGAGGGFCAGGDIRAAWQFIEAGGDPRQYFSGIIVLLNRIVLGLRGTGKPVIAAINGAVGGAGLSLAAACDLRIAAENAKFKQAYTSIGLVPDGGWTVLVPRLIGTAKAMELLLLDPIVPARDALAMGLVNEVVAEGQAVERARQVAARLAAGPAAAFAASKALLNSAQFAGLEEQLECERQAISAQAARQDFQQLVRRFLAGGRA